MSDPLLEQWQGLCGSQALGAAKQRIAELEAENARLRELLRMALSDVQNNANDTLEALIEEAITGTGGQR